MLKSQTIQMTNNNANLLKNLPCYMQNLYSVLCKIFTTHSRTEQKRGERRVGVGEGWDEGGFRERQTERERER
jgi:hypothetical protein